MPPRVSPTQLIVIPIPNAKLSEEARAALTDRCNKTAFMHSTNVFAHKFCV